MRDKLFVYPSQLMLPDGDLIDTFVQGDVAHSAGRVTDLGETCRWLDMLTIGLPRGDTVASICSAFDVTWGDGEFSATKKASERIEDAAFRLAQCCCTLAWIARESV